jgi:hypothetical protein
MRLQPTNGTLAAFQCSMTCSALSNNSAATDKMTCCCLPAAAWYAWRHFHWAAPVLLLSCAGNLETPCVFKWGMTFAAAYDLLCCLLLPGTYAGTFWAARALPLSCACYVAFLYCFWRLGKNLALGGSLFSLGQVRWCSSSSRNACATRALT